MTTAVQLIVCKHSGSRLRLPRGRTWLIMLRRCLTFKEWHTQETSKSCIRTTGTKGIIVNQMFSERWLTTSDPEATGHSKAHTAGVESKLQL